jgi:hypothetical protein
VPIYGCAKPRSDRLYRMAEPAYPPRVGAVEVPLALPPGEGHLPIRVRTLRAASCAAFTVGGRPPAPPGVAFGHGRLAEGRAFHPCSRIPRRAASRAAFTVGGGPPHPSGAAFGHGGLVEGRAFHPCSQPCGLLPVLRSLWRAPHGPPAPSAFAPRRAASRAAFTVGDDPTPPGWPSATRVLTLRKNRGGGLKPMLTLSDDGKRRKPAG